MGKIKKGDFIELEFTGKITGTGEIFDTNIEEIAKKANLNTKNLKPFVLSVGHGMLPKGFDEDLIDKEEQKEYSLNLKPEKAFGKRNPSLVRMIPTKLFHEQQINPVRGMQLTLDGQLTRVLSSSGGRTLIDFNNPLAGKEIEYNYKINRMVQDQTEKIKSLQDFLFRREFDFEVKDKKIIFKIEKELIDFVKLFAEKFKEILGLEIDTKTIEPEKEKDANSKE